MSDLCTRLHIYRQGSIFTYKWVHIYIQGSSVHTEEQTKRPRLALNYIHILDILYEYDYDIMFKFTLYFINNSNSNIYYTCCE